MSRKLAEEILKKALLGNSYSYFDYGDWLGLELKEYWLVAQEISSPEEISLNQLLENADPLILDGVDPQNITKSALLHRNSRKEINDLTLNPDGSLSLLFDQNREIILITSTAIVDWHWCLNRTGQDPYHDYIVACFEAGKFDVST